MILMRAFRNTQSDFHIEKIEVKELYDNWSVVSSNPFGHSIKT